MNKMKFTLDRLLNKYETELKQLKEGALKLGSEAEYKKFNRWLYIITREKLEQKEKTPGVSSRSPTTVVENGVGNGQSTYCILKALEDLNDNPYANILYSFDPREKADFPELRAEWDYLKKKFQPSKPGNYIPDALKYRWRITRDNFLDAGSKVLDETGRTVDLFVSNMSYLGE